MLLDLFPGQLLQPTTPADQEMRLLADQHYSRRSPGAFQFAGPGRKLVLRDCAGLVLWVWKSDAPGFASWKQDGWYCQVFRNQSSHRSSDLIREAEEHVIAAWGPARLYTFVNPRRIRSPNPGYCFLMAGWHSHGMTARGLRLLVKHDGCDGQDPPAGPVG